MYLLALIGVPAAALWVVSDARAAGIPTSHIYNLLFAGCALTLAVGFGVAELFGRHVFGA
jgi:hypothetical protein